ncbi:MAG: hypothetical protein ACUVQT_10675, partial [bacterium]
SEDDYGLVYRRSTDGGISWEAIDSIVPGMVYSSIQAIGDIVYIAGTIGVLGVLRFTKSYDGGNTWRPIVQVTKADAWPRLRIITPDTLALVVSYDNGPAPVCPEVFRVLSYNGGDLWLDSMMVSYLDSAGSQHQAMDTDDSGGVHITWYDYKYSPYSWTGDIFYRASRDSGSTWEPIDSLTVQHRAVASDILAEGNNLHLVWEDDRNGFDENFEIYYRMSTDLGRSWGQEERLTYADNWSRWPSLACGGNFLHLFWADQRDDPVNRLDEIYYKRKMLVGINETQPLKYLSSRLSLNCPTFLRRNSSIRYDLGSNKDGEIVLIDVTGRVIETLPVHRVSGELVFPYNKEVQDGVYFIMLKAGLDYITRKVLVVR